MNKELSHSGDDSAFVRFAPIAKPLDISGDYRVACGSGFTLMMEAMILLRCQQATVSSVARDMGEIDKRLWRVLDHYVTEAHAPRIGAKYAG